jgi:hypothetical protein
MTPAGGRRGRPRTEGLRTPTDRLGKRIPTVNIVYRFTSGRACLRPLGRDQQEASPASRRRRLSCDLPCSTARTRIPGPARRRQHPFSRWKRSALRMVNIRDCVDHGSAVQGLDGLAGDRGDEVEVLVRRRPVPGGHPRRGSRPQLTSTMAPAGTCCRRRRPAIVGGCPAVSELVGFSRAGVRRCGAWSAGTTTSTGRPRSTWRPPTGRPRGSRVRPPR